MNRHHTRSPDGLWRVTRSAVAAMALGVLAACSGGGGSAPAAGNGGGNGGQTGTGNPGGGGAGTGEGGTGVPDGPALGGATGKAFVTVGVAVDLGQRSALAQFGISWTFDRAYETGRFANGDWWVVGPVRVVRITPASATGSRIVNGTQLNPSPRDGSVQGYDGDLIYHAYRADLNVAADLGPGDPLVVPPHTSIVSTISRPVPGVRPGLQTCAVLTVLPAAAREGDFRPPYCGSDKTIRFNTSMLDFAALGRVAAVNGVPAMELVERAFERPWLDHTPAPNAQGLHPLDNMSEYGREIATDVGVGSLVLNLDIPDRDKATLLVRFVQVGIDLWGVIEDGGESTWLGSGGHSSGRKWPILFAGIVLHDAPMRSIGARQDLMFGEDTQTWYVDWETILYPSYFPGLVNGVPCGGYTQADLGTPEWGIQHTDQRRYDSVYWEANYRLCCTANAWYGELLAARIMGARSLWNHDALFDYQDRYLSRCRNLSLASHLIAWDPWSLAMWDEYRARY